MIVDKPLPSQQQDFDTLSEYETLDTLNKETLAKLRARSPQGVSSIRDFLRQGLAQADSQQAKSLFGALMAVPAVALTLYQKLWTFFKKDSESFPEGTWQFYTQFGLREDSARHANETEGFHQALDVQANELDQAAAWTYQCIMTLFEYETLLENEWVERTLLRLIQEELAELVVERLARLRGGKEAEKDAAAFAQLKQTVREEEPERVEFETAQLKRNLNLSNIEWEWVKKRPYRRPVKSKRETYPQYRRRVFLEYLVNLAERLPPKSGALIWDRYYELSSSALPAYQQQMSILFALAPEKHQDVKVAIPLWQAKIAFVLNGVYYLLPVAHHNEAGELLVFDPNKPQDPGQVLSLCQNDDGDWVDQYDQKIQIDRRGNVTICRKESEQIKVLRPTPPQTIKAQLAQIFANTKRRVPTQDDADLCLAKTPRALQDTLIQTLPPATQTELDIFKVIPLVLNWDVQDRQSTLAAIRNTKRGIGSHALTILRTQSSFVFDQSHIFFDAIWGMVIAQVITDGAIESYQLMQNLAYPIQSTTYKTLKLKTSPGFHKAVHPYIQPIEATAESNTPDLVLINRCRKALTEMNIRMTVNDLLTFYRSLHHQIYIPGLNLQRQLMQLRLAGENDLVREIESSWEVSQNEPISLLLPMDASFIDPKLRLFPATFKNFLPDFAQLFEESNMLLNQLLYTSDPALRLKFLEARRQILENLLMLVEYFKMLKRITREGESLSTAAIRYLAHLPPGMQGTLDLIPQHVGALNEILKGEEVFSNVGRVDPTSSLVRFMSAKDDGKSKVMVWGIMCDRRGDLKITLRDFRPCVQTALAAQKPDLAAAITHDYLEAYARGLNQFSEDLIQVLTAEI